MEPEPEYECSGCGEFGNWKEIEYEEHVCECCLIGDIGH